MANTKRIDEAVERRLPARFDRGEEIAHRGFAIAFAFDELCRGFGVALGKRENVGCRAHEALGKEHLDLLVAEPLDIESVARAEMFQPLDRLRFADEAAGAAANDILVAL